MNDRETQPKFVMSGARDVLRPGWAHFEQQVIAIEAAVDQQPGLAFDLAKTLLETACKTILNERQKEYDKNWDLPKLLKNALDCIPLAPSRVENPDRTTESLRKTINGLSTAIHGVCELRGDHGFASHGRDATSVELDSIQAHFVARAADAIVHFLFGTHQNDQLQNLNRKVSYGDLEEFNDWVDSQHDAFRIFELLYRPSEVLYHLDFTAYQNARESFQTPDDEQEPDEQEPRA